MSTTSSPYTGLEPCTWRSLLARAAVFRATRTKLSAICDLSQDMSRGVAVQGVLRDLEIWAQEFSAQDVDDKTLVAGIVQEWNGALTRTLQLRQLDPAARELLTELQALVGRACSTDPFHEIFAGISALASTLYGASWRPARLLLAHIRSHPRGGTPLLDPYAVTATTPWPPTDTKAAVELQIFCDGFGPAAYAALPMLLTHECVCHVPARQDRARNDSAFAEGFLDWAAYFFLDLWAGKLDTAFAPAVRRHARELRHLLTSRADTPEGRARLVGHEAAETLQAWFEETCYLGTHESRLRVAQLAVLLNQIERPLRDKDYFVSRLASPLPPDLQVVLKDWEEGRVGAETLLCSASVVVMA